MSAPNQDIAPLEAVVAWCEREVARLAAAAEIENLQSIYGYYIDKGLWNLAVGLFTEDATYEYGQQGVYVGRQRIREALTLFGPQGLEPGQLNNYMMLQPMIDVADDDTARARWRSDMQLNVAGKAYWGEGTYVNEYVKEAGVWKISKLHFYVTMLCDYDKGWVVGNVPMAAQSEALPPDRPPTEVYGSLPEVYLPAYHYGHPVTAAAPRPSAADFAVPAVPDLTQACEQLRGAVRKIVSLSDQEAVERLQRAYGYYVDKAMWPDVAALFCESGTLEIGGRGVFVGKRRVLEYLGVGLGPVGPQSGQIINHQQFQGIVTVAPDGLTAKGRWTAFVMGGSPHAAIQWGDVTYENEYVKEEGVWKISRLHAPFTMYSLYADGWHKSTVANTRPDSFPPPPDLPPTVIYLTFPSFYCEPFHYPNPVTGKWAPPPNRAAGGLAPMNDYVDAAHPSVEAGRRGVET
jgi:hypothetical protein